jgi:uncharacterized membrane protein YebE (DUF533 family)
MKVSHPNAKNPSPEELKNMEKLKALIELAIADGKLSKSEMECIKIKISADGKVTFEELELCRELIWDKIQKGELEYQWD